MLIADRYRLGLAIGSGGMANVFEAVDGQRVALKLLKPAPAGLTANFTARFVREVRAMQAIDHPNVMKVLDAGTTPMPYIAMELAAGCLT